MTTFARRLTVAGLLAITYSLLTNSILAQTPRINYVMPMGGQAGSTFEMTVTGQDVDGAKGLYFGFPGATVEVLGSERFEPKVDPKKKKKGPPPGKQLSQKFKVTLPANAPVGMHDVRLVTGNGISNPRTFIVSDMPEVTEQEPNDDLPKAQKVAINTSINGVVTAGTDVDYYQFTGKKGQRIVVSCLTTSVDSKLPVEVRLYSMSGRSLGYSKFYQGNDAVFDAVLPADDDYYIRLASFSYTQGGPDYFYRLTISTAPWIDAVFPSTIEPGKEAKVTVYGRNLPGGVPDPDMMHEGRVLDKLTMTVKAPQLAGEMDKQAFHGYQAPMSAAIDGFGFRLKNDTGWSNTVLITYARAPVVLEAGEHHAEATAQKVEVPCEIAGRFEKRRTHDWYSFSAKKGQVLTIDAFGSRIGSPLDLYYRLYSDKGTLVTEQDENLDITANQFYTRNDDPPTYRLTVPADGEYKLMVGSRFEEHAGPRMAYTVRIMPERPNFTLVAMAASPLAPDSVVVSHGSNQIYTVFVLREGGFTGDITLTGENLPAGIKVAPQIIGGTQKTASLVVSASPDAPLFAGAIKVVGTAKVDDAKLVRTVRGASITWPVPQNAPTISRMDREMVLAVGERPAPYTLTAQIEKAQVMQGEKIAITVKVKRDASFKQPVTIVALNLPGNLVQQPLQIAAGSDTGKLTLDSKGGALPAGVSFTMALRGQTQPIAKGNQKPKGMEPSNYVQASNPVTITIVARDKGNPNPKTKGKGKGKK